MLDRFVSWIAWHLPRKLVYHCAVRLMVNATVGKYEHQIVPELTALDALQRWTDAEKTTSEDAEVSVA